MRQPSPGNLCAEGGASSSTGAASGGGGGMGTGGGGTEPTRLGLHFTQEELVILQARAASGPFKSAGDAFPNSPGEWDRIAKRASDFMANPSTELWSNLPPVVTTSACGAASGYEREPAARGEHVRDAAFYSMGSSRSTTTILASGASATCG